MSLSYNSSKAVFEGNGLSKVFPFNFKIWETEQVLVFITDPMGYDSQATDFKVELLDEGGSVTYLHQNHALPAGYKLTILRNMPFEQRIDLISGTRFDPQVIEEQLDQATAERQQLLEAVERSVKILPSDNIKPEELVQNIYKARDKAVESANEALISEENAKKSELEAINHVILGQQILDNTIQEGLNAQNNIAIDKDKALQALKEQEINSINSVIAEGEQQIDLATKQAQRAENEADRAKIEADRAEAVVDLEFGTGLEFVAKKLTVKLSDALDLDDSETTASAKAAKLLNDKDISLDANIIELQNGLNITNNNVTIVQNAVNKAILNAGSIGMISMLPFRHNKLPSGWYFMNGLRYAPETPQWVALNNLDADFKTDWGIVKVKQEILAAWQAKATDRYSAMSSNTSPSPYKVQANTEHYPAWKAFNKTNINNVDCWIGRTMDFAPPHNLDFSTGAQNSAIVKYDIISRNDPSGVYPPNDWEVFVGASPDFAVNDWIKVDEQNKQGDGWGVNIKKTFNISVDNYLTFGKVRLKFSNLLNGHVIVGGVIFHTIDTAVNPIPTLQNTTLDQQDISLPNWFHTDGRGPVMRAVDGVSRQVGSLEEGGTQTHAHNFSKNNIVAEIIAGGQNAGTHIPGEIQGNPAARGADHASFRRQNTADYVGASETKMLNRGMTPAIYLGV